MSNEKLDAVIRAFKARFQPEAGVHIPMALRQESTDVVFRALLEEDKPPFEMPGPMVGFEPDGPPMPMTQDPEALLDDLLGASMSSVEGQGPAMPPMPLPGDPAAPSPASGAGQPDLAAMLGMM